MILVWSRNLDKNAFTTEKAQLLNGFEMNYSWLSDEEKKHALVIALGITLLLSITVTSLLVNLAKANPILTIPTSLGNKPPDLITKPPTTSVFAPENHTLYATNIISLSINVSVGESSTADSMYIAEVCYKADWQTNNTCIYERKPYADKSPYIVEPAITKFSETLSLTSIPDGNHSFVVYAKERGTYYSHTDSWGNGYCWEYYYDFEIDDSSSVFFTIDTTSPSVSILSLENRTYETSDIPLNFTVNEPVSRVSYSLDGLDNVTVTGNTTLNGLPVGGHNVTVYARDKVGNVGASETVYFTISDPFPIALIASVSAASAAIIGIGLLFYFKKRKH